MMRGNSSSGSGGGPCGACKFLRRKCVKGCIFAPYFDSEQGATHFAAVHKVFGASNVSKLLSRIPVHKRLDAVITICYEALARIRDPVYGCVGHIFSLQQQVVNLQAELAYIQAHLSTLQRPCLPPPTPPIQPPALASLCASSTSNVPTLLDPQQSLQMLEMPSSWNSTDQDLDYDLQAVAREFVARYLPGVRSRSSNSC
ncbi:hypothetical protein HHK36_027906 [Tetracentron sinense]|uniref:LOB domain-containing protein n=1 Tax=Tetracentron sinense TaxID=13715 RepID=A0A834YHH4_TETSI|nr:hypothetical protein HHK36_027906 [Tetracentron sinense]